MATSAALKKSIRSMTGYAQVRRATAIGELTCSLRTVNHRGFDIHFYIGNDLAPFENAMRTLIKQSVARGHVEVRAGISRQVQSETAAYDSKALGRYLAAFEQASREFGLTGKPDLNVFLTLPGVFTGTVANEALNAAFEADLISALTDCLIELNASREREGRALAADLDEILRDIETAISAIGHIREYALPQFQQRLRERLNELLGSLV